MRIGVDIVQPIVPEYRVALFEGLSLSRTFDICVQASPRLPSGACSVHTLSLDFIFSRQMYVCPGRTFWQRGLRLIKAKAPGDVLVLCGDLRYLSNLPLLISARLRGCGVLWWGHGWSPTSKNWRANVRHRLMRCLPDAVMVYSGKEQNYLVRMGHDPQRTFAANNAMDLDAIQTAMAGWDASRLGTFQQAQGLAGRKILLFCSVLNDKTRLDQLLRMLAMPEFVGSEWRLVVIGEGAMRQAYVELAKILGVADRILWLGAITKQELLAPWFLSAVLFVYPGNIGLSLLHAFAYGLPVVTHANARHHGPEIAAMQEGLTGFLFAENDVASMAEIVRHACADRERLVRMGAYARATVWKNWSMKQMIQRFANALQACSAKSLEKANGRARILPREHR